MKLRLDLVVGPVRITIGEPDQAQGTAPGVESSGNGLFELDGQPDSGELRGRRLHAPRVGF